MAEKLAPGVVMESPPYRQPDDGAKRQEAIARARARRDASRWTLVVGVAMMFAGTFSAALAVGGALMVVGGFVSALVHGRRLRRLEGDPWEEDAELDAWEEEHFPR